jgi:hypothetical protein
MNFKITFSRRFIMAIMAAALMLTACAAPAPVVKVPPTPALPAVPQPEIRDILGLREWNPNVENTLLCASREPDGNLLTYTWTAENGTIKGEGQKVIWVPPGEVGEYEITVKVSNGKGGEASFSKHFAVVAPEPPPVDKTIYLKMTPPSTSVATGSAIVNGLSTPEIQCVIPDRDPSEFTYTWAANAGKLMADGLNEGKASRVGWIAPNQAGQYLVGVLVTDNSGNKAIGEVTFEVICCGRAPN